MNVNNLISHKVRIGKFFFLPVALGGTRCMRIDTGCVFSSNDWHWNRCFLRDLTDLGQQKNKMGRQYKTAHGEKTFTSQTRASAVSFGPVLPRMIVML